MTSALTWTKDELGHAAGRMLGVSGPPGEVGRVLRRVGGEREVPRSVRLSGSDCRGLGPVLRDRIDRQRLVRARSVDEMGGDAYAAAESRLGRRGAERHVRRPPVRRTERARRADPLLVAPIRVHRPEAGRPRAGEADLRPVGRPRRAGALEEERQLNGVAAVRVDWSRSARHRRIAVRTRSWTSRATSRARGRPRPSRGRSRPGRSRPNP